MDGALLPGEGEGVDGRLRGGPAARKRRAAGVPPWLHCSVELLPRVLPVEKLVRIDSPRPTNINLSIKMQCLRMSCCEGLHLM